MKNSIFVLVLVLACFGGIEPQIFSKYLNIIIN
jgi:hypothetical protein